MNKYEYSDRIVFSNEYMNNIILEYKDIKSITIVGNNKFILAHLNKCINCSINQICFNVN